MAHWYYQELGDGVEAFNPSARIQEIFLNFFGAANLPKDMAVFSRYDPEENMVTVYLSPACESVAMAIEAQPCERPDSEGLSLLVGDQRAWEILFPDAAAPRRSRRR